MLSDIEIHFEDVSPSEANKLALELQNYLLKNEEVKGRVVKRNKDDQSFGEILSILLAPGVSLALARGLSDWLKLKQSKKITIKENGDIVGENLSSDDVSIILHKKFK